MTDTTDQQAVTATQEDIALADSIIAIEFDNSHAAYRDDVAATITRHRLASVSSASAEIPEGMKPWTGGDGAPDDWDGGSVLRADGQTEHSDDITIQQWKHPVPRCKWNVVAYTPARVLDLPEPVPATNQAGEVERNLEAQRQTIEACACLVDGHPMRMDDNARMTLADAIRCLRPDESLAGDALDAKTADYNGHKPNRYLPEIPHGASLFAVNPSTGAWHYVNHAGTWQGMPNPLATQPATSQEGEAELDWRKIAKAAGEHGVRYRTNAAFERFLSEIAATPTPPTLSEDLRALGQAIGAEIERQCSIGAGKCGTAPDGSGLFEVDASLDLNGFAQAMSRAALAQVKAS